MIPGTPLRQLLIDGRPLTLSVEPVGTGTQGSRPRGERWEWGSSTGAPGTFEVSPGKADRPRPAEVLKAPMPGLVGAGSRSSRGQREVAGSAPFGVLEEPVKMENELKAVSAGVVEAVRVAAGGGGRGRKEGQVLIEFQAACRVLTAAPGPGYLVSLFQFGPVQSPG